ALNQVTSVLPKYVRDRVYMTTKASVASWLDVADLLDADSLKAEAGQVRRIVEQYSSNVDKQWMNIKQLPFYKTVIVPRLPKLRTVSYTYVNEVYRELTAREVMYRYQNDADYRSGRKSFALYEYWHLFNMVKDKDELMALYKRAYDDSRKVEAKPWALAANNLAVAYLERGLADTT
ncbi:hypothetical protein EVA_19434, partial [gut metagenome]